WLPGYCSGELITAIAMTEPGAGSDLQGMRTTAVREGDHYVLNGSKTFISNGQLCDLVIVAARTDPDAGYRGSSLLVVERGCPASNGAATWTRSACTPKTPRNCSSTTSGFPSATCSARKGAGSWHSCRTCRGNGSPSVPRRWLAPRRCSPRRLRI